ncbi:MAG: hypothetical protein HY721_25065 [Planctomycetes bacterium]|nr:hypothetical protein [Planctomycetota bacterium]
MRLAPLLRWTAILLLSGALASWVYAVHRLAGRPPGGPSAASRPAARPEAIAPGPFAFRSNEECEPCHREIYEEWVDDQHALAWFNEPLLPQDPLRVECNNCHAPRPVLETGIEALPVIRGERFEEGVGCIECHRNGGHAEGPLPSAEAPCNPRRNPAFTGSAICASCHAPHGAIDEWRGSAWAAKGYTCQACHMPLVDAPSVTSGPVRRRRSHRMRSQRDPEVLREAVRLEARLVEPREVEVSLTNAGAGHSVPGEISNRELFVRTVVTDAAGREVARHRESFQAVRREQRASVPSTQLRSGETRTFRYALGAERGKVTVSVGYKLLAHIPDERSVLVWREEIAVRPDRETQPALDAR